MEYLRGKFFKITQQRGPALPNKVRGHSIFLLKKQCQKLCFRLCVFIVSSLFFIYAFLEAVTEIKIQIKIKQNPWKIPVEVFIVTKVVGFRPLALLKLTL